MSDFIVEGLSLEQKITVGEATASRLREKRPDDVAAGALAARLEQGSSEIRGGASAGPSERGTRKSLVDELRTADRRRDRAVSAFDSVLDAWMFRDDAPAKKKDAAFVRNELLPKGLGFLRSGYGEQTAGMTTLIHDGAEPKVAAAIGRLGIADFVANIAASQTAFENVGGAKGGAHLGALEATRTVSRASRRWDTAMRTVTSYVESVYEETVPAQKSDLDYIFQPLVEANIVVRTRIARGEAAEPDRPGTPPAPPGEPSR
ncbi:MAG: hypothetical protein HY720_22885 [Planctomycetes bacterium]|nr:hypothetical protein [Planctomycetota bacterium]